MNIFSYHNTEKFLELTRVAQRVMFEYQQAILGIVYVIKNTLNFDSKSVGGVRHKFFPIPYLQEYDSLYEKGSKVLRISPNMWAWDFNYSSSMEYHLGECAIFENSDKEIKVEGKRARMSIIAIPDASIYIHNPNNLESFSPADECASKLVFVIDVVAVSKELDSRPPMWKSIEECDKYISDQLTNTPNETPNPPVIMLIDMAEVKDETGLNTVIQKINEAFIDKYGYKLF